MRWSTKKRLEFIESRLFWDGKISRKDLTEYFDVSIPQATKDIKKYSEIAPTNIQYDSSAKHYVAGNRFLPVLATLEGESYFSHLIVSGLDKSPGEFFCGRVPQSYQLPLLARAIDSQILKQILKSMHGSESIEIEYQSMNTPDPTTRWISPHAFGFDGLRWHVRGLCHKDKMYKDFVLSRIISVGDSKIFPHGHLNDFLWHNNLVFKIAAHKDLSPGQKKSIECEFNMVNGEVAIEIKAAFHFYLKQRLGLHKENESISGKKQQIILTNREEIETKLALLREIESSRIKELSFY